MRQLTLLLLVLCACAVAVNAGRGNGRGGLSGGGRRHWGWGWGWSWGWSWWWRWTCFHPWGEFSIDKVEPVDAERVSQMRPLIGGYAADIGACPDGTCHYDHRRDRRCKPDGYICTETEEQIMDLDPFGNHTVNIVTGCKCCKDVGIEIRGQVVDAANNAPIASAKLRTKSASDISGADGAFSLTVDSDSTRVVINAKNDGFINAMKVVEIAEGLRGPVEVTIAMVRIAEPVSISATEDNKLNIAADSNDPDATRFISIPARSFRTRRGQKYTGVVLVSVNFIDTSNPDVEQEIPGVFVTNNGEPLLTDGIFALSYRAETGEPLSMGPVKVTVPAGMRLWKLNSDGEWVNINARPSRGKRQALTDQFLVDIETADWVNIDRIYGAPSCYFKTRIFDVTGTEIATSTTAAFRPNVVAYRHVIINNQNRNQRMQFNPGFTTSPATTCHTVQCPDITDTADTLLGLIQMKSHEVVPIGTANIYVSQTLLPKILGNYPPSIQTSLSSVFYDVTPYVEVYANFIDDVNGPFYTDKAVCEASDISQPAFHFLKPDLPSYIEYPDDTELCTARIGFFDRFNFYNIFSQLEEIPTIHAVSTWSESGDNYYYTDTTVMQPSADDDFIFACITYRCSNADANTTVMLDFEIPVLNVSTGNPDTNATMEYDAFTCYGNCTTSNCRGRQENAQGLIIDGSFIAPLVIPADGPDFFRDSPNSCAERGMNETFAAIYYCHSKQFGDTPKGQPRSAGTTTPGLVGF